MSKEKQNTVLQLKVGALVLEYGFSTIQKVLKDWSPESLAKKQNTYTK